MMIDKGFQINTETLDRIDFTPFLKKYRNLLELMTAIELKYKSINLPPELEGEIFNYYSADDFMSYLLKRYPSKLHFNTFVNYLIDYRGDEQ